MTAAKMMYFLDPKHEDEAVSIVAEVPEGVHGATLQVLFETPMSHSRLDLIWAAFAPSFGNDRRLSSVYAISGVRLGSYVLFWIFRSLWTSSPHSGVRNQWNPPRKILNVTNSFYFLWPQFFFHFNRFSIFMDFTRLYWVYAVVWCS